MSDKVGVLKGLLARVQKNAARPRVRAVEPAVAPPHTPSPVAAATPRMPAAEATFAAAPSSAPILELEPFGASDAAVDDLIASTPDPFADEAAAILGEAPVDDELLEEDIVDITIDEPVEELPVREAAIAGTPEAAAASASPSNLDVDIDFDDEDEQKPPSSSRRPKVAASTMDEALAGAAAQLDVDTGREVPLKTPPPESGPQEAMPPAQVLQQPPPPALELDDPGALEAPPIAARGPTTEQLGNTIDLEEPRGPTLELEPLPSARPEPLARPREELEAELLPPQPASEPAPAAEPPVPLAPPVAERAEAVEPQVVARPPAPASRAPAAFADAHRAFQPATFKELLDASLSL